MSQSLPATRGPDSPEALRAAVSWVVEVKVQWGDMDALGHVNNVVYFKYLENVRLGLMETLGIFPRLFEEGSGLVVADAHCRFKAPVVYPDTLLVGVTAEVLNESRIRFDYQLFSTAQNRVAAVADTLQVCVSPETGRPMAMPDWFRETFMARP